jgi:N-acetylglucosamine kinase-like BadF-type ATPase
MSETTLLGIDGGGTSTVAWLADAVGTVLGRGQAGPSNAKAVGADAARLALDTAIGAAFRDAGREPAPVAVACLGLAGFDRPDDKQLLERWSSGAHWADRLVLVNDGDLVLAAGTPEGFGVAVIAGTGSIAVGRGRDGRTARAGGWGHLIGDEGSAYGVALAALRLVARRADGREALRVLRTKSGPRKDRASEGGALTEYLCRAMGVASPGEIVSALYSDRFDRARIAALAPVVLDAAEADPDVIPWILEPAGFELGQAVCAVARTLDWTDPELPLAMAGGFLLSAEPVVDALVGYVRRFGVKQVSTSRVTEPVRGALVLARGALQP